MPARRGHTDVVKILLKAGEEPDYTTCGESGAPLFLAALYDHPGVVKELLKAGANPIMVEIYGETLLNWATAYRERLQRCGSNNWKNPESQKAKSQILMIKILGILCNILRLCMINQFLKLLFNKTFH